MTENTAPVALVSGGSRGIGRAVVLRLAAEGHDVSFCYQSNEQAALELEKEAAELGHRALAVRADVTDAASVRDWVARTESELGPIDVAVSSAGITRDNPLVLMSDDDWHKVLDTNLDGVYHVCRAVIFEMMKRKSGTIINISSIAGVYGNATQSNYSASKAGIIGFTRALAKEVGRYNIRANVVAPGYIETDMTSELSEKVKKDAAKSIPLRRFGQAEEVADLVAYLAGGRAAYITGSVLQIDGGPDGLMAGETYQRLRALADHHGADYRLIEHVPEGRTEVASALRGHALTESAKSLVVAVRPTKRTCRYVLAVVPGDRRLDLARVAECAGGRKAGFADRETAERLAGSVSGSIIPFSFHPDLELIVDEDLLRGDTLFFNAARLDLSMALATEDYLRMARPRIARIAETDGSPTVAFQQPAGAPSPF